MPVHFDSIGASYTDVGRFRSSLQVFLLLGLLGLHVAADVTSVVECQTGC